MRETSENGAQTAFLTRSQGLLDSLALLRRQLSWQLHPITIVGESGAGKEALLRAAVDRPIVAHNCATLSDELAESELFGHTRGAFTGAVEAHAGLFRLARGKVLFLDEVGELSLRVQATLLRVLEDWRIYPIGDRSRAYDVSDVVVVAATHRDLAGRVREGSFREDLLHRFRWGCRVIVPPLRERPQDVRPLAERRLTVLNRRRPTPCRLLDEAWRALRAFSWPGNVRQLYQVVERIVLLERDTIGREHVERCLTDIASDSAPEQSSVETGPIRWTEEQRRALDCYHQAAFNMTDAAALARSDPELSGNRFLAAQPNNITARLQRLYVGPLLACQLDLERTTDLLLAGAAAQGPLRRRVYGRLRRFVEDWRQRYSVDPAAATARLQARMGSAVPHASLGRLSSLLRGDSSESDVAPVMARPEPTRLRPEDDRPSPRIVRRRGRRTSRAARRGHHLRGTRSHLRRSGGRPPPAGRTASSCEAIGRARPPRADPTRQARDRSQSGGQRGGLFMRTIRRSGAVTAVALVFLCAQTACFDTGRELPPWYAHVLELLDPSQDAPREAPDRHWISADPITIFPEPLTEFPGKLCPDRPYLEPSMKWRRSGR